MNIIIIEFISISCIFFGTKSYKAIIIYISPDKEKKQKLFGSSDFLLYICREYT